MRRAPDERPLTPQQKRSVQEHLQNPPPGSAVQRALAFGIDLSLTMRNVFQRTLAERLEQLNGDVAAGAERSTTSPIRTTDIPK